MRLKAQRPHQPRVPLPPQQRRPTSRYAPRQSHQQGASVVHAHALSGSAPQCPPDFARSAGCARHAAPAAGATTARYATAAGAALAALVAHLARCSAVTPGAPVGATVRAAETCAARSAVQAATVSSDASAVEQRLAVIPAVMTAGRQFPATGSAHAVLPAVALTATDLRAAGGSAFDLETAVSAT